MYPQTFHLWTTAVFCSSLFCLSSSFMIVTPRVSRTLKQSKYIQGLHYGDGNLYFGTNCGRVCCIERDDNAKLEEKWINTFSSRNIQKISGTDDSLLISCDSVDGEMSRTVICDAKTGNVLDDMFWKDTTIYETLTDKNEWIRVNAYGEVMVKTATRENDFQVKYRMPIHNMDFISTATIYKRKLYAVTMSGKLFVINIDDFDLTLWHRLHIEIPTCIHVMNHPQTHAEFLYIGNHEGIVHFTQIVDGKMSQHTQKHVHNAVATQIDSNYQGVFVSFDDSQIVALEIMSFRELFSVRTNNPCYINIDSFCLSPRGIFYPDNINKKIELENIDRHRLN